MTELIPIDGDNIFEAGSEKEFEVSWALLQTKDIFYLSKCKSKNTFLEKKLHNFINLMSFKLSCPFMRSYFRTFSYDFVSIF